VVDAYVTSLGKERRRRKKGGREGKLLTEGKVYKMNRFSLGSSAKRDKE